MKYVFIEMDYFLAHHKVDDTIIHAFLALHQQGHKIYLCTRRNRGSLKNLPLPVDGVIASAGSYIEDHAQELRNENLSNEDVYKLEAALNGVGVMYQLETTDLLYMDVRLLKKRLGKLLDDAKINVETGRRLKAYEEHEGIAELSKYSGEAVHKIGFMTDAIKKIKSVEEAYGDDYHFVYFHEGAADIIGEIRKKDTSIAAGVKAVLHFEKASVNDAIALCEMVDDINLKEALPHTIVMEESIEQEFYKHHLIQ